MPCLQRAKGEAGLADYEVRTWQGWHHHTSVVAHRHVIPDPGSTAGKKDGPRL